MPKLKRQATFTDTFDQSEKDQWRLDPEKSQASFCWHPCILNGERHYHFSTAIEIKPYPNPLGYGGSWGSGGAADLASLEKVKADWLKEIEHWKARGLTRVYIREEAEVNYDELQERSIAYAGKAQPAKKRQLEFNFD